VISDADGLFPFSGSDSVEVETDTEWVYCMFWGSRVDERARKSCRISGRFSSSLSNRDLRGCHFDKRDNDLLIGFGRDSRDAIVGGFLFYRKTIQGG
jgi:hypothetical protein